MRPETLYPMKRIFLFSILVLALSGVQQAAAQTAGAFARMGFGARGIALSNALAAASFGDTSPYYNPALAPFASGQSLEASAAFMTFDRELQFLQLATPLRPNAGIAAGIVRAAVTGIDGRDGSGFHTENYSTDELAFFLAFGTRIGSRATLGAGVQLFRADYFDGLDPVISIGIDLGLTVAATDNLRLGLVVDDLLARYSWDTAALFEESGTTTSDNFPLRLRLGAAYALMGGRAHVMAEYESRLSQQELRTRAVALLGDEPGEVTQSKDLTLHDSRFRLGVEYQLAEPFVVRAGVDDVGADAFSGVRPSAGFMVEQPLGSLVARGEYAFVLEPYGLGTMHLITLRVFL